MRPPRSSDGTPERVPEASRDDSARPSRAPSTRFDPRVRPERSFWQLIPRRNLRHAFFLVLVVIGVLFIRHTGGLSLGKMFDSVAPAPTPTTAPAGSSPTYQHLEVRH